MFQLIASSYSNSSSNHDKEVLLVNLGSKGNVHLLFPQFLSGQGDQAPGIFKQCLKSFYWISQFLNVQCSAKAQLIRRP